MISRIEACEISIDIDRATASRLGVTAQAIDNTLYDAFGQRQVSTMYTGLNQYHVVLEVDPELMAGSRQPQYPFTFPRITVRRFPSARLLDTAVRRLLYRSITRGNFHRQRFRSILRQMFRLERRCGRFRRPKQSWECL